MKQALVVCLFAAAVQGPAFARTSRTTTYGAAGPAFARTSRTTSYGAAGPAFARTSRTTSYGAAGPAFARTSRTTSYGAAGPAFARTSRTTSYGAAGPAFARTSRTTSYGAAGPAFARTSRTTSYGAAGPAFARTSRTTSYGAAGQGGPKQAVVDTTAGTFVIDLAPDAAPNQTVYFMKLASDGAYDGTIFHRAIKYGMVQGGDPLTKDPSKRTLYGTGGLNAVKAEARAPKMTRGSVAAVMVPGKPDSAGAQFFIVLADQPALDNQYTVFGHVSDGIEVLQKISEVAVDDKGLATDRMEIRHVTIRDTPAEPFVTETPQELGAYRAVLDTSSGPIAIEFFVDKAPDTVRQFMRLAAAGVYNGMAFHRVAPGFVIQSGALSSRTAALTAKQQALVHNLAPEFNDKRHVKGIVSMARGEAPDSASTSFFIVTGPSSALDGQYTAFGRVVDGMSVVEAIEATPREGETPKARIDLKTVRIEKGR